MFSQWWESWFPSLSDLCSPAERDTMPGMLTSDEMDSLGRADEAAFDPLFIQLMSRHHIGAIQMADDAMRHGQDPRIRIMAHGIRHEQRGEIQLMHGVSGMPAVRSGIAALFAPFGQHPSDQGRVVTAKSGRSGT